MKPEFRQDFSWINTPITSDLPFQYGGATQCGRITHDKNQDAIALVAQDAYVVGIVCDGCSSGCDSFPIDQHSNNEVGARLLAKLTADVVGEQIRDKGAKLNDNSITVIEKILFERLEKTVTALATDEDRRDIIQNFFATTILGFAIDADNFSIFGCGDGLFAVDRKVTSLQKYAGKYLATRLLRELPEEGDTLVVHKTGSVKKMRSLLVATDGFEDLTRRFGKLIGNFLCSTDDHCEDRGLCSIGNSFRKHVWRNDRVSHWNSTQDGHDDRSFILLRHLKPNTKLVSPSKG